MPVLISLGDARDIVVLAYGVMGVLFFAVAMVVTIFLFFTGKGLIRSVRDLIDDSVRPTLDSVRNTARSIQGTTEFVGQTAVQPIIRTYGIISAVRRGLGVVSGLARKKKA